MSKITHILIIFKLVNFIDNFLVDFLFQVLINWRFLHN